MVNNINNYLDYHYTPFSKTQCIKGLLGLLICHVFVVLAGTHTPVEYISTAISFLACNAICLILIIKYPNRKISRYIYNEGISFVYSLIFMFLAYRVSSYGEFVNSFHSLLYVSVFIMHFILVDRIILHLIKKDVYNKENSPQNGTTIFSFIFGVIGTVFGSVIVAFGSIKTNLVILVICLSFLSLTMQWASGAFHRIRFQHAIEIEQRSNSKGNTNVNGDGSF